RVEAARFSLLLSAPAIAGAGLATGRDLDWTRDAALIGDAAVAAGLAFIAALIAIALMMRWLKTSGFGPFVLYRLALGGVLIALIGIGEL
ncbi:MAG: undecaprenyl-diphosphate phosphatase, partial [Pseudomonadota bacterium]